MSEQSLLLVNDDFDNCLFGDNDFSGDKNWLPETKNNLWGQKIVTGDKVI